MTAEHQQKSAEGQEGRRQGESRPAEGRAGLVQVQAHRGMGAAGGRGWQTEPSQRGVKRQDAGGRLHTPRARSTATKGSRGST